VKMPFADTPQFSSGQVLDEMLSPQHIFSCSFSGRMAVLTCLKPQTDHVRYDNHVLEAVAFLKPSFRIAVMGLAASMHSVSWSEICRVMWSLFASKILHRFLSSIHSHSFTICFNFASFRKLFHHCLDPV
jgi:hypothetical protein